MEETAVTRTDEMGRRLCEHCDYPIVFRNLSGYCDHLYYPDRCETCNAPNVARERLRDAAPALLAAAQYVLMTDAFLLCRGLEVGEKNGRPWKHFDHTCGTPDGHAMLRDATDRAASS